MNSELKIQLDKIVNDLAKTEGIEGSVIVDGNGELLSHYILQDVDIELFGPMANVITGSSKRLINFANNGEIERVLVESKKGKALFLHLGNVHFIVLMKTNANVGMVMISSKRASEEIINLTKDLTPIQLEEQIAEATETMEEPIPEPETTTEEPSPEPTTAKTTIEEPIPEPETIKTTTEEPIQEETIPSKEPIPETTIEEPTPEPTTAKTTIEEPIPEPETIKTTTEGPTIESSSKLVEEVQKIESVTAKEEPGKLIKESETPAAKEKPEPIIPVIKPPIAFPKLKKVTEIPKDEAERADLLLSIYESIFRAMSIGASKIMGVAPARGLTRKFLPVEDCKTLLDGVDVQSNSTIDFNKIRENAEKIPLSERESSFKESFGKIIAVITENYGKVMGYAAFRAMIRPEFKIINESYGHLLDDLGVTEQLHPELRDFFN